MARYFPPQPWLARLHVDRYTAIMSIKMSIPPAILVCAIMSDAWINYFTTSAYLAPIYAVCALPTLPRAKLVCYNVQLLVALTLTYAWALLAGWSGIQARKHTAKADLDAYNSSAETVVAVLLTFWIWCAFTFKSAFPAWNLQSILAAIGAVVMLPAAARASSMDKVIDESGMAFKAFLTGQAVGFIAGLVIFPQSCTSVFHESIKASLDHLHVAMTLHRQFIHDFHARRLAGVANSDNEVATTADKVQDAVQNFIAAVAKAQDDLPYALREVSWGRLDSSVLQESATRLAELVPAASGLSTIADMIQHTFETQTPSESTDGSDDTAVSLVWNSWEESLFHSWLDSADVLVQGVEHAQIRLGYRTALLDEEASLPEVAGGSAFVQKFALKFEQGHAYGASGEGTSQEDMLTSFMESLSKQTGQSTATSHSSRNIEHHQWLQAHTLVSSLGRELVKLLLFMDELHARKRRLIVPRFGDYRYWVEMFCKPRPSGRKAATSQDRVHDARLEAKDPDHLPPTNVVERLGDDIRKIGRGLKSPHAAYGLRGAAAVMCIAILSFLHSSQTFFFEQRFVWALFAILLSMGRTTGSSTFQLGGRVLGTTVSMVVSYIIWYVADQKSIGVLVFFWLWLVVIGYLFVKYPALTSIWFVVIIAAIVMIADPLQVRKLGEKAVANAGQAVYPPYILFPYRLATVSLGVLIGFFWTIFPYPLSEHSETRKAVAQSLYALAKYDKSTEQIVLEALYGNHGSDAKLVLRAEHRRNHRQLQAAISAAKTFFHFQDWEFTLGGRLPTKPYAQIIHTLDRLASYMTVRAYVCRTLAPPTAAASTKESLFSHDSVITRLIILRSALRGAHALPPGLMDLQVNSMYEFPRDGMTMHRFATLALICSLDRYTVHDVNMLTELVRELVGDIDFSVPIDINISNYDGL